MGQQSIHFLLPFFYDLLHPFPEPSVPLLICKPGPAPGKAHGLIRAIGASDNQCFRAIQVISFPVPREKDGWKSSLHVHPATVPVFQTIGLSYLSCRPIHPPASPGWAAFRNYRGCRKGSWKTATASAFCEGHGVHWT